MYDSVNTALLVVACTLAKTAFQQAATADPAAGDDTSAADGDAKNDIADRQQPEREPVQRRVTVVVVTLGFAPITVRRIDPVVSCKHRNNVRGHHIIIKARAGPMHITTLKIS